jgi:primosomal protein N' (replication factor Y)
MYVQVFLLNGFERALWYHVPQALVAGMARGCLVQVPLQKRIEAALVTDVFYKLPATVGFAIRDIADKATFPGDEKYNAYIEKISAFYCLKPLYFYQRIRHFLQERTAAPVLLDEPVLSQLSSSIVLTDEQQAVVDATAPLISTPQFHPLVIHGVTGSGKTEVYKALILQAWQQGKSAVLLLPEVSLAMRFEFLLKQAFPHIPMYGFHSGSSPKMKKQLWQALHQTQPLLIIGVHLPMMLPIPCLGLIVIDEEHDQSFIEKKHPKINTKEMALWRAQQYGIPIVLGSATPSLATLYNVQTHGWPLFSMTKRFGGAFPVIKKVVLTNKSRQQGKYFWISKELEQAVADRLFKNQQVIIFINRRGYSFFVQCRDCGFIFTCKNCSVSLTYHEPATLRCHYCDYACPLPFACTGCKATGDALLKKGIGTQQVVHMFKTLFPAAVIERADLDSTKKKKDWQEAAERMHRGEIDILIGTQSITKGYHFPGVTLVGVLWADANVHFPVYNAAEITLQQLIQVAGRAGRASQAGEVIVQMMHDHQLFDYADEQAYLSFAKDELAVRSLASYPPYIRLAGIELRHTCAVTIDAEAHQLAEVIRRFVDEQALSVTVLGPSFPVVARVQEQEIRQIALKGALFKQVRQVLLYAQQLELSSAVHVVVSC